MDEKGTFLRLNTFSVEAGKMRGIDILNFELGGNHRVKENNLLVLIDINFIASRMLPLDFISVHCLL